MSRNNECVRNRPDVVMLPVRGSLPGVARHGGSYI